MIYYFPNHKGKRVSSEVQRGYSLRVLVLQSAIHDFARRREKTLISPRCPPLSMHPSTPNTTLSSLVSPNLSLSFLSFFPHHRFRERDPLPSANYSRPDHHPLSLLHCPSPPIPPPPAPPPPPPPPIPLHTVLPQHRLASPPSTTIHAALAAKAPLRFRPSASHFALRLPQHSPYPAIPVLKAPTSRPRATRTSPPARAASYTTTLP